MKTSGFPDIPLGLGLSLETIATPTLPRVDDSREIPDRQKLENVEYISFDSYSIMRDIISATPDLVAGKTEEIMKSFELCCFSLLEIPELIGIVHFHNSFNDRYDVYERLINRGGTSKVDIKEQLLNKCMTLLAPKDFPLHEEVVMLTSHTLVYSHHVIYLAKITRGNSTVLILESHSGKILTKPLLNKKYRKNRYLDIMRLPFNMHLVKTIGDGNYIRGVNDDDMKVIATEAEKWTPNTDPGVVKVFLSKNKM